MQPSQGEGGGRERAVEQGAAKVDANGSCKGVRRRRNGSGKEVLHAVHGYGEHKATRRALGERLRRGEASAEWSSGARLSSTWRRGGERRRRGRPRGREVLRPVRHVQKLQASSKMRENRLNLYFVASQSSKPFSNGTIGSNKYCRSI